MKKILLTISYDGTNYFGWQRQNKLITIQETLEKILSKVFCMPIKLIGASRTDKGVHARAQKAMFNIQDLKIPVNKIPIILNTKLPNEIIITDAQIIPDDFHARYSAKKKIYKYIILNRDYKNIIWQNFSWHVKNKLDKKNIYQATRYFIGEKDFASFCTSGSNQKSTVRIIYDFQVSFKQDFIIFKIIGNGFLYNMIRIIIGTLIDLGIGKINLQDIKKIILAKNRTAAGRTAPPHGLILFDILY